MHLLKPANLSGQRVAANTTPRSPGRGLDARSRRPRPQRLGYRPKSACSFLVLSLLDLHQVVADMVLHFGRVDLHSAIVALHLRGRLARHAVSKALRY